MNLGNWREVCLGDICELRYGKSLPEVQRNGGKIPVYGSNGVVGHHDNAITAGPTVVVGRKGSYGEVNFSSDSCWPIDTTYYVDKTATKVDLRWLAYRLTALGLTGLNKAAAVPGLNREDAYRQRLLLPPPIEQQRIAEMLDSAEELRAKRRAALAQLDNLTQAIFLDLFGDPVSSDHGWLVVCIAEVAGPNKHAIVDGPFGSSIKPDDYQIEGVPVIRIGNITKGGYFSAKNLLYIRRSLFESLKRSSVLADDVLISRVGTIGNTCIFPFGIGDALLSTTGVCKVTLHPKRMLPVFLHEALKMPSFQAQIHQSASTSVQKYFNLSALRNWKIIIPPLNAQQDFALRVTAVEKLKIVHRASLVELDALFASVQHRAFRGELLEILPALPFVGTIASSEN